MANYDDYTVAWITATWMQFLAAKAIFDDHHQAPEHDGNIIRYHLGRIAKHNVILCYIPRNENDISATVKRAEDMLRTFQGIRVAILVGIGGGVPSRQHDIRLGDIVVSAVGDETPGMLQYDYDITVATKKFHPGQIVSLQSSAIQEAAMVLQIRYSDTTDRLATRAQYVVEQIMGKPEKNYYARPSPKTDKLYKAGSIRPSNDSNSDALDGGDSPADDLVQRTPRQEGEDNPAIHYGLIASARRSMNDAYTRDTLAAEKNILCFEKEAAGLLNIFPSFVIKGISDYADTHGDGKWEGYATAAASAYAKDFLYVLRSEQVKDERRVQPHSDSFPSGGLWAIIN